VRGRSRGSSHFRGGAHHDDIGTGDVLLRTGPTRRWAASAMPGLRPGPSTRQRLAS
jgi:hypothetical protein